MSLAAMDFDLGKVKEVVERCGMVLTERKASTYLLSIDCIRSAPTSHFM